MMSMDMQTQGIEYDNHEHTVGENNLTGKVKRPEIAQLFQRPEIILLTIDEVANALRVNRSKISRMLRHAPGLPPELAYVSLGGRKMVRYTDLIKFIDKRRVA